MTSPAILPLPLPLPLPASTALASLRPRFARHRIAARSWCWLAAAALLAAAPLRDVRAAGSFDTSGSLRMRHESLSGQSRPGFQRAEDYVTVRTILAAEYRDGRLRAGAELIDSRAYGARRDSAISTNEVDAFEPTQLYLALDLDDTFGRGSRATVQAGRFAMNLGSRRLVAAEEYRNTTTSMTGLRLDARLPSGWSGTAWYVLPVTRLPDDIDGILGNDIDLDRESTSTRLRGLLLGTPWRPAGGALELGYVRLREGDTARVATRDRELSTWTLRWHREPAPGSWDHEIEFATQQGRASAGVAAAAPRRPVDARFLHARLGYQWHGAWQPRLALEYDAASGDEGPDRIRRYDTLFGGRRADLAPSGLYNQVGRSNLVAPGLRLELAPHPRFDAMLTLKDLRLASRTDAFSSTGVRDPSGTSGDHAGTQLDLRLRYWALPKRLRLEFDGLWLDKGRFLERAPNARPGDTRFASLNATLTF